VEHHIIYISTADHLMTAEELSTILEESRQWNQDHGITGILLYVEGIFASLGKRNIESAIAGRFMQILEGSREEVEKIFNMIKEDSRHFNITPLENAPSSSRYFESWQMGFKILSASELEASTDFFNPDILFASGSDQEVSHPLNFLKSFYLRGQSQQTSFQP